MIHVGGPFRVLQNRNYLKYFGGQLISMSGTWMQSVAQSLLVFHITNSAAWLGIVAFSGQLPAFLAAPLAGVTADARDRRKILIATQAIEMVQAFVLAGLVFADFVQIWHIVVLSVLLGMVNAFDSTARHAFGVDMVGKEGLTDAIALNSVLINVTRIIGPTLAGVTVGLVGAGWCFTLNGLSYIPVIWGLASMKLTPRPRASSGKSLWRDLSDGAQYARRHVVIFRILMLSTAVCLVACPFMAIIPVFAFRVLGGSDITVGWLNAMQGLGAVTAAVLFTGSSDLMAVKRKLIADIIFWGLGLVTLGLSRDLWLSLGAMFTLGYFMMSVFPSMNNVVQQLVDDRMRGRVMSLYMMTFLGAVPVGSLILGTSAERFGASKVVTGAGLLTMAIGLALVARGIVRERARATWPEDIRYR